MPFVQPGDFAMHYEITGNGPETILLIHGNIASCRWWDKYLSFLPTGCQAVAMDLRGCGQSGRPGHGHTIRHFADDIHFLVQELNLKKFHLLGHSMGGQIALYYSLRHPEQVWTLTLLDSVPADGLALDDTARTSFDLLMSDKAVLQQAVAACMPYSTDRQFIARACDDAFACAPNVYKDNPGTMHETVLLDQLSSLTMPVLIVHGREDAIIPLATMASTLTAMPAAAKVILDNCGHSPQIELPETFSKVYNHFINQYPIHSKEV